jgi:hypothetical protein
MEQFDSLAVLALDLQPRLLEALPGSEALVRRCRFALEAAGVLGLPVYLTEQVPDKLGPTHADLVQAAGEAHVFAKSAFSAAGCEALMEAFEAGGIGHVLLLGAETPICVYQSVVQLLARGIDVTLLTDCVGARRQEDAEAVLGVLAQTEAHLLPSETVFYSILGDAGHPRFRDFSALVKAHAQPEISS